MQFRIVVGVGALALFAVGVPSVADAHIVLTFPTARHPGTPPLKDQPCGVRNEQKPATAPAANRFRPGQMITMKWTESIYHPGHFRIAFLQNGDAFKDPSGYTDIVTPPALPILLDGIDQHTSGRNGDLHQATIQLPNVTCDACTLQIIQVMTDKAPYTPSPPLGQGDDIYHECADIVLSNDQGGPDAGVDARGGNPPDAGPDTRGGTGGTGGGGAGGSGGAGGGTGGSGTGGAGGGPGGAGGGGYGGSSGSGGASTGGASGSGTGGTGGSQPPRKGGGGGCAVGNAAPSGGLVFLAALLALALRRRRS